MSNSFVAPWTVALQAPLSIGFSKNTGVGCRFPLQRIFLTQGLNPCLLHWQESSLPLSHQGSPNSDNFVVVQSLNRVQLCNPMDYSMPGSSVLCCLLEFA